MIQAKAHIEFIWLRVTPVLGLSVALAWAIVKLT